MQLKKHLIIYFAMAYFFSWIVFIPLALNKHGYIFLFPHDVAHAITIDVWHAFGGLGPIISAMLAILLFSGKNGLINFFKEYSLKKMTATGWFLSVLFPLVIFGFSLLVSKFVNGKWIAVADFFQNNNLWNGTNFMMWIFPMLTYGFGEEGGWRGFALPQLQTKYSAMHSTIILSLFWIGWHIPTFFYRYQLSGGMLVGFVLGLFAGAIWMTFLFNYTKGSLLAVSLWHFTFNFVSMVGTEAVAAGTMSTVIMIVAVFIVFKFGKNNLSPFTKAAIEFGNKKFQMT
jgi:uncharacterized protein